MRGVILGRVAGLALAAATLVAPACSNDSGTNSSAALVFIAAIIGEQTRNVPDG